MSHSFSFFLSVLSALEATWVRQCYQSQLYLTTSFPLFLPYAACVFVPCLSIACWLCCPPCLLDSPTHTFSHKLCTHMHTHALKIHASPILCWVCTCQRNMLPSCVSFPPSLLWLSHQSFLPICFLSWYSHASIFLPYLFFTTPLSTCLSLSPSSLLGSRSHLQLEQGGIEAFWHTHTQVECNRSVCLVIDLTRLDG